MLLRAGAPVWRQARHLHTARTSARTTWRWLPPLLWRGTNALAGGVALGLSCHAATVHTVGVQELCFDDRGCPTAELTQAAHSWVCHKRQTGNGDGAEDWVSAVRRQASRPLKGTRVLVFVNPTSGQGASQAHCDEIVRPMLAAMGCLSVEVQQTDDRQSAMELLGSADLSGLDAVLVLGGDGTVNEVVHGLTVASAAHAEASATPPSQRAPWQQRPKREPLSIPVGIIPEGRQNILYSALCGELVSSAPSDDQEVVRAVLRVARMRSAPVPLLQCQTDDGQCYPLLATGLRFATQEALAVNGDRLRFLRLPHLFQKLAEMWAVFRLHKYSFEMSYLPADSSEPAPSFDSWEQSDRWRTHEGDFVWLSVLPSTVTDGLSADGSADAAVAKGGCIAWAFAGQELGRTDLEQLQASYSASAVGRALSSSNGEGDGDASMPPGQHLWQMQRIKAFSIECREESASKRAFSIDGTVPYGATARAVSVRGRTYDVPLLLLH